MRKRKAWFVLDFLKVISDGICFEHLVEVFCRMVFGKKCLRWVAGHQQDGTHRRGDCSIWGSSRKPSSVGAKAESVGMTWSGRKEQRHFPIIHSKICYKVQNDNRDIEG